MRTLLLLLVLGAGSSGLAAKLTDLTGHLGQYPDQLKLLGRPAVKQRLTRLLGAAGYALLVRNTQTQEPLSGTRQLVYFSGIQAHRGGETGAVVVYDAARDALKVWLKANGRVLTFEEGPFVNTKLFPQDLNDSIQSLYQD